MTENEFKYCAFLGYSQLDNCERRPDAPDLCLCWGDWLFTALKNFPIPAEFTGQLNARAELIPDRFDPIFQDREEQAGNATLSESVRQALEQSKCLIVICSPRSAKSLHLNEVVRYFKQLGRSNRILPIVIAGEPGASDGNKPGISPDEECFVPALRHPVKPDGMLDISRRELGSIFADARHGDLKREILAQDHQNGGIELETAKIQLIAGVLGVGFNGLWGHEVKRLFAEAKALAWETRQPIQQAANPALAAPSEMLAAQNETREAQRQIQELRQRAQDAQGKVLEVQQQAREALGQVAEARNQALAAESKVLEAQQLARDAQTQLEEARTQVREAQNKVLEMQNLPQDVKSQIQEAQNQAREAQSQIEEVRNLAQKAKGEAEVARNEARDAQNRFLEAQNQVREAQSQVQETEDKARQSRSQLDEARNHVRVAESNFLEAQHQVRDAQNQAMEARNQVRETQNIIQELQNQTRDVRSQIQDAQNKTLIARRLMKIFALLAVLATLAAGITFWQRKDTSQAQAKAAAEVSESNLAAGALKREEIKQAQQKIGDAEQPNSQLRSLDELATRIPAEEVSETLKAAADILNDPGRSHFQDQLLDHWMTTNSPAAFDWSCQLTNVVFRQHALEKIIPALAADNFANTLARLNDLKPAPAERIYTLLFQRWAGKDPVQAIEQRQKTPGHDADARIISTIMAVWSEQQPGAALNWLESQPDSESFPAGTWRSTMIAGLFQGWARNDLEAATTACQHLPDGMAKDKAWEHVLSQRIVKAPAAAAESVKNLAPGNFRDKAIAELCQHWADIDAPEALAWAQTLASEAERIAATERITINWARKDPQAATQFANQQTELSGAVFGEIASVWFQHDVAATTNWVANLPAGEKKEAALRALVESWSLVDPSSMVTYALGLPAGDTQTRYLAAAGCQLAKCDFPGTVELLLPLSDPALRQSILEQAARSCELPHINQAAKYIAAMPAGDDQKACIKGLVSTWTSTDPEAAVNWLDSFAETNSQPEVVASVIKAWSQPEPSVVARWLANLPAGTASEGMINAFLEGVLAKYPDYAAQWTQSVSDETKRQKYQTQVARQWMKTDAAAALKWIDSLALPDEIKQSMKTPVP